MTVGESPRYTVPRCSAPTRARMGRLSTSPWGCPCKRGSSHRAIPYPRLRNSCTLARSSAMELGSGLPNCKKRSCSSVIKNRRIRVCSGLERYFSCAALYAVIVWAPVSSERSRYSRMVLSTAAQFKRSSALSRLDWMASVISRRLNSADCRVLSRTYRLDSQNSASPTARDTMAVKRRIPHTICLRRGKRWFCTGIAAFPPHFSSPHFVVTNVATNKIPTSGGVCQPVYYAPSLFFCPIQQHFCASGIKSTGPL